MNQMTDQDVLQRLAGGDARDALAELVGRYGGLVYSAALRQVRDRHLAEDVTQAVFIVLVRKAHTIRPDAVLAAWFFTVTRHACQNAMRIERRRRYHETKKAAMTQDQYLSADVVEEGPHPLLIEAIAKLHQSDRSAVVLRYFQNRSHREIAQALAVSEEAARKRLTRALQKMRSFFERHGVADAETVLSSGLAQSIAAEPVSPALVSSIVNVALISHAVAPSVSVLSIAKGASRMITFTPQIKAAMITAGVLGVLGAAAVPMLKSAPPSASVSVQVTPPASRPAVTSTALVPAPDDLNDFVAIVSDKIKVHVVGVSPYPGDANSWWSAAGNPIGMPDVKIPRSTFQGNPPPSREIVLRIEKPDSVLSRPTVLATGGMMGFSSVGGNLPGENPQEISVISFTPQPDAKTITLNVRFAEADWQTIVTDDKPGADGDFDTKDYGKFHLQAVDEEELPSFASDRSRAAGKKLPTVAVLHGHVADPMRIVVVDDAGKIHQNQGNAQSSMNGQQQDSDRFDLPLASIKQVLIQVRPFTKKLEVTDISLMPGQTTSPIATVSDISGQSDQGKAGDSPSIYDSRTNRLITIPPNGKPSVTP
jgi:RNA polymerase sigma factor (sigma-70 family)